MEIGSPRIFSARGAFVFDRPQRGDPARDERFIQAVSSTFPTVIARQLLPPEAPPNIAHVQLASTSSQLLLSAVQAELVVQFYGDYNADLDLALTYVHDKMAAILEGLEVADMPASVVGMVSTLQLSMRDAGRGAESALLGAQHLRHDPHAELQDVSVRLGVRFADSFFVNLETANYEARGFERPIMPGVPLSLAPWEGDVTDHGIRVSIDVNNRLRAIENRRFTPTTTADLDDVYRLLVAATKEVAPSFAKSGALNIGLLEKELA